LNFSFITLAFVLLDYHHCCSYLLYKPTNEPSFRNFEILKKVRHIAGIIWKILFLLNFTLSLALLYPVYYTLFLRKKTFGMAFKVMRVWAKYLAFSAGISYTVIKEADLPKAPYLICPNHSSYLDIIITYCVFPDYFVFMGKKELGSVPLFNIFFKKMNILVDRKSNSGSHRAFLEAASGIDKGHCMALFPEGTISRRAPEMLPFKNGAFKLAAEKKVSIVPVTFINNWNIMGDGAFFKAPCGPGKIFVHLHAPVNITSASDVEIDKVKKHVHTLLQNKISEYLQKENIKPATA
jgi:1-acyl-sn-glycerol-3-phosphate acyltransferase